MGDFLPYLAHLFWAYDHQNPPYCFDFGYLFAHLLLDSQRFGIDGLLVLLECDVFRFFGAFALVGIDAKNVSVVTQIA